MASTEEASGCEFAPPRGFDDGTRLVNKNCTGVVMRTGVVVYHSVDTATHQTSPTHLLRRCHERSINDPTQQRDISQAVSHRLFAALDARAPPARALNALAGNLINRTKAQAQNKQPSEEDCRLLDLLRAKRNALRSFFSAQGIEATNRRGKQPVGPAIRNRTIFGGKRTSHRTATHGLISRVLRTAPWPGIDSIQCLVHVGQAPTDEPP